MFSKSTPPPPFESGPAQDLFLLKASFSLPPLLVGGLALGFLKCLEIILTVTDTIKINKDELRKKMLVFLNKLHTLFSVISDLNINNNKKSDCNCRFTQQHRLLIIINKTGSFMKKTKCFSYLAKDAAYVSTTGYIS